MIVADIVGLLLPFFGLILIGYGAARITKQPVEAMGWLNTFIIYAALPALFFKLVSKTPVEELARIHESGAYDLIVLDTPPSRHALDFLEAPERLGQFLDRTVLGWFVRPSMGLGAMAWRTTSRRLRFVLSRIEAATGTSTLGEISDFFTAMDTIFDGLAERGRRVQSLLRSPDTAFVLVAGPDEQVLGEADHLTGRMAELGVALRGAIMNRVQPVADGEDDLDAWLQRYAGRSSSPASGESSGEGAADWARRVWREAATLARAQARRRSRFATALPAAVEVVDVPEQDGDVHDLAALARLAGILSGPGV